MSAILQLKNILFTQPTKPLFRDLNLAISRGDRIGLVGHNGSGKSTLFSLLSKQLTPDEGEIIHPKGLQFGLVEQFIPENLSGQSLEQAVLEALPRESRLVELYRVQTLLKSLGFSSQQLKLSIDKLSGGQQNLALVARAMIVEPELLLMDEPSNHMDVVALGHMKNYLLGQRNLTFLLISHDRDLLDDCCNRTCFLRDLKIVNFDLPYAKAKIALAEYDATAGHRRRKEEQELNRVKTSARRLALWGKTFDNSKLSKKARSMEKRVEKLEQNITELTRGSGLDLNLETNSLNSKTVLTLEGLNVSTPDQQFHLLDCEFLIARPGDRIALLGANGTGKSTTLNRIMEEYARPVKNTIRLNPNVSLIYYDQELRQFAQACSRFDWLRDRVEVPDEEIKRALIQSGVSFQEFDHPVNKLSGGEKARMMFLLIRLVKPNLLILDEPTNHIDLEGREQLEEQLLDTGTTLIITSHDRRFLENIATRFWVVQQEKLTEHQSLQDFYVSLGSENRGYGLNALAAHSQDTGSNAEGKSAEDEYLERIEHLESLLQADRKRKTKFQKPEKQRQWAEELEQLWRQLD
ncbi:MAG: ABC-F family ATP-binding cassette domain-containing protein [Gammaproteobacteria bacterium]|nr:ABC-F family ATP-binding cassette domain-containing protein [Gammaproteobacteria bacterium]